MRDDRCYSAQSTVSIAADIMTFLIAARAPEVPLSVDSLLQLFPFIRFAHQVFGKLENLEPSDRGNGGTGSQTKINSTDGVRTEDSTDGATDA